MRTEDRKNKSQWLLAHLHMIKKKSREKKNFIEIVKQNLSNYSSFHVEEVA